MKKLSLTLAALLAVSTVSIAKEVVAAPAVAVEPTAAVCPEPHLIITEETAVEGMSSKDFKFVNFSLMHGNRMTALGPRVNDTYLEIELGGRKGPLDFYGYIDFSDVVHDENLSDFNKDSDKGGEGNFFSELMPRLSMNDMLNADLSVGPIKEIYVAGYLKAGDGGLWVNGLGIGTDIEVPWLGRMGLNAYALYVAEDFGSEREDKWDGYLLKNNWFKPFYFFNNGTFLSYQGYMAYQFDAGYKASFRTSDEFQWFNGLYWHSNNFAVGYGLKYTKNMINGKNGDRLSWNNEKIESTGFSNFFAVTYKF